jgi:NAD(P)-dependent dehydrogenase (short-subunit alcohol dehydrogenase family)
MRSAGGRAAAAAAGEPRGTTMADGVVLVVGAGDATGGAIARRFAREGYVACVTRRNAEKLQPLVERIRADGGRAHAFASDARREEEATALFARIEAEVGPIEVVVFNIGANVRFGIAETTARVYFKVWEMACFAGFLAGREAARVMLPRGCGTILFTGATASLRGREGFAAFAGAKHALRALAQSMARELGPRGIHVAHVVIDGAIDTEFIRTNFPERYALREHGGILDPEHIADAYWVLHAQPRDAWTHELDLRPWSEQW